MPATVVSLLVNTDVFELLTATPELPYIYRVSVRVLRQFRTRPHVIGLAAGIDMVLFSPALLTRELAREHRP